jgi:hypothetical protein
VIIDLWVDNTGGPTLESNLMNPYKPDVSKIEATPIPIGQEIVLIELFSLA